MCKIVDPETNECIEDDLTNDEAFGFIMESGNKHWLIYNDYGIMPFQPWEVMR